MLKQPILSELKQFTTGLANIYRTGLTPEVISQLTKCSLHLLDDLPVSREIVLEYFAMVFDVSVCNFVSSVQKDPKATVPDDETVVDIQDTLENLVKNGPPAWAPLLSSWSLKVLGTLSNKYNPGRINIGAACSMWLGSSAMRGLIGLAASCFVKLNSIETEDCVSILLSIFNQHSPHFDWVVARLGGCFPLKVISKILQCGLKGFVGNFNSTLDSEIGILSYLSFAHENDLKFAFREMLIIALQPVTVGNQTQNNTIPYLMHLCSMSEILLQPAINVFLDLFNESVITSLIAQTEFWPSNFKIDDILPTLSILVLKIKSDGTKTVLLLARLAEKYLWCQEFLEHILQELETLDWEDHNCSLIVDISREEPKEMLLKCLVNGNIFEQQTAVRLILIVASKTSYIYHQMLAELLSNSYSTNNKGFGALLRLLTGPCGHAEMLNIKQGIDIALERITMRERPKNNDELTKDLNVLTNLVWLLKLEKENNLPYLRAPFISPTLLNSIPKILNILTDLLNQAMESVELTKEIILLPDKIGGNDHKRQKLSDNYNFNDDINLNICDEKLHAIVHILHHLQIGGRDSNLQISELILLAQCCVKYFFWTLIETNQITRMASLNRVLSMLATQCTARKSSRTVALRELLEGALFHYGNLFGGHNEVEYINEDDTVMPSLMKINQKHAFGPGIMRSILHAGLIGHGLKAPAKEACRPEQFVQTLFLRALSACCCNQDDMTQTIDGFSTISLLLVELVSSDVMYNGLPWPDEDFTRVTMERDLQIRRTFKNAPILWSILGLVASYRPALCFTSVLLRALCASVLHQWRARTFDKDVDKMKDSELFNVTYRLLELMSMGQLLPAPLSYLHTVLEYLDPTEIALVLKDSIWNYMKENVPAPLLYTVHSSGLHWRDQSTSKIHPQFIDPLRNIMQRKLPKLGTLYHYMFVMGELGTNDSGAIEITECSTDIKEYLQTN